MKKQFIAAVCGRPRRTGAGTATPGGYVIRYGSQAQVGWLGAVLEALR